ncbi:hypothetical protein [Vulgatibacter sp.]|uniref:hypothetical protein n=1 Tax=Vulgatibacter sp. TaxID=1971226 RepID=UPI00356647A1
MRLLAHSAAALLAQFAAVFLVLVATRTGAEVRGALHLGAGLPEGFGPSLGVRVGVPLELEAGLAVMPLSEAAPYYVARAGWVLGLVDGTWGGRWTLDVVPSLRVVTYKTRPQWSAFPFAPRADEDEPPEWLFLTGPVASLDLAFWPVQSIGFDLQVQAGGVIDGSEDPAGAHLLSVGWLPVLRGALGIVF